MRKRLAAAILGAAAGLAVTGWASTPGELRSELDAAVRAYDTSASTEVLSRVRSRYRATPTTELAELHARSSLAVAELLRIEMEWLPEGSAAERRTLGQRIDATAKEGLDVVSTLPQSSESWRMRADLIATLIRSDFRAKKHEQGFKDAVAKALELDGGNARAWVTSAKPYLFAPPERGRDLEEAVRRLTRALELQPGLEPALLLRATAFHELGEDGKADADWRAALAANPECRPALRALGEAD